MRYSGEFAVGIEGRHEDAEGYVVLPHGSPYRIVMWNDSPLTTEWEIKVDGDVVGTWQLRPFQRTMIERPSDEARLFTFFASKSAEGIAVGAGAVSREDKGVVSATIWPEVRRAYGLPEAPLPPWQIVKEKRATFAATPAQLKRRPPANTPWPNLALAGDFTETGLPSTIEGAIRSGFAAADRLLSR